MVIAAYAKALEIIPRQLCDNAGFDATDILNKLRQKHVQGGMWYGVDMDTEVSALLTYSLLLTILLILSGSLLLSKPICLPLLLKLLV